MSNEIDDVFKNFDMDEGSYILGDKKFKINELSVAEMEELQDKEAELEDLSRQKLTSKEILQKSREWDNFILKLAFGDQVKINEIKRLCTAGNYKQMIAEVFVFLGRFSGMEKAREYIKLLKEKQDSQKKTNDI